MTEEDLIDADDDIKNLVVITTELLAELTNTRGVQETANITRVIQLALAAYKGLLHDEGGCTCK